MGTKSRQLNQLIPSVFSYTIAEWATALKYEHLSKEAIQAAKLFWSMTERLLGRPAGAELNSERAVALE